MTQEYHEKFLCILVADVFQLYLAIGLSLLCNTFMLPPNNKRKVPANNQNLERDPLSDEP